MTVKAAFHFPPLQVNHEICPDHEIRRAVWVWRSTATSRHKKTNPRSSWWLLGVARRGIDWGISRNLCQKPAGPSVGCVFRLVVAPSRQSVFALSRKWRVEEEGAPAHNPNFLPQSATLWSTVIIGYYDYLGTGLKNFHRPLIVTRWYVHFGRLRWAGDYQRPHLQYNCIVNQV